MDSAVALRAPDMCPAGSFSLGVDQSGNITGCATLAGESTPAVPNNVGLPAEICG